jgi:predicted RNase H-like HicB family nuclease
MRRLAIYVRATWDDDAEVWVATSEDIPGLVTEAANEQELMDKLQMIIPDLVAASDEQFDDIQSEIPLVLMAQKESRIRLRH